MNLIHLLMDPASLLAQFGDAFWWFAHLIVLVECGLFFPFLPGDSLLFAIGMFTHEGSIAAPLQLSLVTLIIAAFAGNVLGYEIGRALGEKLYERDGRFLKRAYFDRTIEFFDHYGRRALVIGRFVPIVRTFVTVVAGVGRMPRRIFLLWSGVGAVGWVVLITLLGYALGGVALIRDHLEVAVLLLVAISVVPMLAAALRRKVLASRSQKAAVGTITVHEENNASLK
ncbi:MULTISPECIES: DedA family protein [unclassified Brachybacterium]|uniref:DedA family protein n=1 Tax=unclassified Brachybacterium TaxID=2623841 RepID=UPI004033A969